MLRAGKGELKLAAKAFGLVVAGFEVGIGVG